MIREDESINSNDLPRSGGTFDSYDGGTGDDDAAAADRNDTGPPPITPPNMSKPCEDCFDDTVKSYYPDISPTSVIDEIVQERQRQQRNGGLGDDHGTSENHHDYHEKRLNDYHDRRFNNHHITYHKLLRPI